MNVEDTLKERGARYGSFTGHAHITQNIKRAMQLAPKWEYLSDDKKEALEMVAHKIGRILNGDASYIDGWRDCEGYIHLVVQNLQATPGATDSTTTCFTIEGTAK